MDPKPRPHRRQSLDALRRMTPEQKLAKAFELSAWTKALFIQGLRDRFPDLPEDAFRRLVADRLAKCHNQNY